MLPRHQSFAEHGKRLFIHAVDQDRALAQLQRELHGICEAPLQIITNDNAVHHHIEIVRNVRIGRNVVSQVDVFAVDASANVAFATQAEDMFPKIARFATGYTS